MALRTPVRNRSASLPNGSSVTRYVQVDVGRRGPECTTALSVTSASAERLRRAFVHGVEERVERLGRDLAELVERALAGQRAQVDALAHVVERGEVV